MVEILWSIRRKVKIDRSVACVMLDQIYWGGLIMFFYYKFGYWLYWIAYCIFKFKKQRRNIMDEYLQELRMHFNVILTESFLSLTLINPNITPEIIEFIKIHLSLLNLKELQIVIIQCANFDDQLLTILAKGMPKSIQKLSLDFSGCQSIKGEGLLQLFQSLDGINLRKLHLDLGSIYDINDIVMEGLALLLSNLSNLEEFYLDLYEIDQITAEGYLNLAEGLTELQGLKKLHLDLSANYNLNEDALEIMFDGLAHSLAHLTFKILDSQEIGGGSFFKLAESLTKMTHLRQLTLTISTFNTLNQKGVYSIIRAISKSQHLQKLTINFSNINLPEKMLTYLTIGPKMKQIVFDISCNRKITFGDFLSFGLKLKHLQKIQLNVDFCTNITEDVIQEVLEAIAKENKCHSLRLKDRNFSLQFQNNVIKKLLSMPCLQQLQINSKITSKRYDLFTKLLQKKKRFTGIILAATKNELHPSIIKNVLQQSFNFT